MIIWEYRVKWAKRSQFEALYSPNGAWARFFSQEDGYLGTTFLRDTNDPQRYVTIDRWTSREAYETFLNQRQKEYRTLDAHCDDLTEEEAPLVQWETNS
jgi:heme-degrading monooxygenase HmoA